MKLAALLAAVATSGTTSGQESIGISGIVESIDAGAAGILRPPWDTVQVGDDWSITYTFDPGAPDSDPSESFGNYDTAVSAFTITIGEIEVSRAEVEGDAAIVVVNDSMGVDQYGGIFGWTEENEEVDFIRQFIDLKDPQGQTHSSDALPDALELNDFGGPNTFFIRFERTNASILGTITGIELDPQPPPLAILCPADVVVPCDDNSGAIVNFPTATIDPLLRGCRPVTISCSASPGRFPIGATPVVCTAVDRCGQVATCSFRVTVQGKEADWAHARRDGQDVQELGNGIAIDPSGNVFVVGTFAHSTSFTDPLGAPVVLSSAGGNDVFLAKYDQGLNLLWLTAAGGPLDDEGLDVATDSSGNAYIVGIIQGAASFNPPAGSSAGPLVTTSAGGGDGFLAKFDANGDPVWVRPIGGAGADAATGVAVDSQDEPYVTGYFQGTIGIPRPGGFFLQLVSLSTDCFVIKWSAGTTFALWARQTDSDPAVNPVSAAFGRGIAVSATGEPFVTGEILGTVPFPPLGPVAAGLGSTAFAAKCGPTGFAWVNHSGNTGAAGHHDGRAIAADNQGNVYFTGYFRGAASFAGGGGTIHTINRTLPLNDYFIVRVDAGNGDAAWAVAGGVPLTANAETRSIAVDPAGEIYITGFDHPSAPASFVPAGKDVVVRRYDSSGSLRWSRDATGWQSGVTAPNDNIGNGIAVGRDGCIYVTGGFNERLIFGNSLLLDGYHDQAQDVFVGKLCPLCCPEVVRECAECRENGSFIYRFRLINPTKDTIANVQLVPESPSGMTFTPDKFTVFLAPGQSMNLETVIQGAQPCSRICFRVSLHTSDWRECCTFSHCFDLPYCCEPFTYTTTSDFNRGVLLNLSGEGDEMKFASKITPFPYVNVACSDRGTMARIDANTGQVVGEYLTAPHGMGGNPSRTTVDKRGNVWIANRDEFGHLNGVRRGSITKIALVRGGTRVRKVGSGFVPDPDGAYLAPPFLYNSGAIDRDGDGLLKTSRGLGDILSWDDPLVPNVPGAGGGDLGTSWAEDELISIYARPDAFAIRTLAIDCANDLWVGGYSFYGPPVPPNPGRPQIESRLHQKLDASTGIPVSSTTFISPTLGGGYGGLLDSRGVLWSAGSDKGTLRFDPALPYSAGSNPRDLGKSCGNYGLAIDPQTCLVWHVGLTPNPGASLRAANGASGRVYPIDPSTGNCLYAAGYGHGYHYAQGLAVDESQNVWVAHSATWGSRGGAGGNATGPSTVGHIKTSGAYVGNVSLSGGCSFGKSA